MGAQLSSTEKSRTEGFLWAIQKSMDSQQFAFARELPDPEPLPDATSKFFIYDERRRLSGFGLVSSTFAPEMVHRSITRAKAARNCLPPHLGSVVLLPLDAGWVGNCSYAVFPVRRPLRTTGLLGRLDRIRYGQGIVGWLCEAVRATAKEVPQDEIPARFLGPLGAIATHHQLPTELRRLSEEAIDTIQRGTWTTRTTLMHNDLWMGNILAAPGVETNELGFHVIDWAGSETLGYPVYDLLRLTASLGMGPPRLRRLLEDHAGALGCSLTETRYYACAALGHLLQNLQEFPFARYRKMVETIVQRLGGALGLPSS